MINIKFWVSQFEESSDRNVDREDKNPIKQIRNYELNLYSLRIWRFLIYK